MVPTEPVSSCSSPKPYSDTKHILHHNGQLPNPVFWLSGNKLELRPRDLESHNCTIFLQHQTLQLTKVKFVEEENSLPKCVSFTINMVPNSALREITAMIPGNKIRACLGFVRFTNATECLQEDVMMFVTNSPMLSSSNHMQHFNQKGRNFIIQPYAGFQLKTYEFHLSIQQSGPASRVPKQEYW
jgi:hypothetical protein